MSRTCLKCGHVNPAADGGYLEACPQCGAIYTKVERAAKERAAKELERQQQQERAQQASKAAQQAGDAAEPAAQAARGAASYATEFGYKMAGALGALVAVVAVLSNCTGGSSKSPGRSDAACRLDLQCIGDRASIVAAPACQRAVEARAKHSAKWTDGMLEPKFSRFRWLDGSSAKVTLIGDRVQFQNGFGAFTNMVYMCDVDMSGSQPAVLNVRVSEGRLPV